MEQGEFKNNFPEANKENENIFPPEIVEQFKDIIRTEHPVPLDKIPLTLENTELLISARMYLGETQEIANEIMDTLKDELIKQGESPASVEASVEHSKIYPPLSFLENGRLFTFWTNCDAQPEAVRKAVQERKEKGQEARLSYPVSPCFKNSLGVYRELTLKETKKSLKPGRDEFFRKLDEKRMREMGIEPDETE